MYVIIQFLFNNLINFLFLIKIFLIEIFFNDYNLMKTTIYTLVEEKGNKFKGKKFYLTNLPFNLKNTKEFRFKENVHFTNNLLKKSKNNILIVDVSNLYKFTNLYFNYDEYNIFYKIDIIKLKNDFGGIFFVNQNFTKNLFDFKYLWFFSENNFSGFLFNNNLFY